MLEQPYRGPARPCNSLPSVANRYLCRSIFRRLLGYRAVIRAHTVLANLYWVLGFKLGTLGEKETRRQICLHSRSTRSPYTACCSSKKVKSIQEISIGRLHTRTRITIVDPLLLDKGHFVQTHIQDQVARREPHRRSTIETSLPHLLEKGVFDGMAE